MKFSIAALLSLLTLVPAYAEDDNVTDTGSATLDVIAAGEEDLTTLVAALNISGLISAVSDPTTNLTVFAPTDDAFASFPTKLLEPAWTLHLTEVLLYHVAAGYVTAGMLTDGMNITTLAELEGPITASVSDSGVSFSGEAFGPSTVVEADLLASNGVIHKVDAFFLPYFMTADLWTLANSIEAFSTISSLITQAGLEGALQADGITVFAPDNAAFEDLPVELFSQIASDEALVTAILSQHIASGVHPKATLMDGMELTTVNDQVLTITVVGQGQFAEYQVNGVSIQVADQLASNGIVHIITAVLYELPTVAPAGAPAGEPTAAEPTASEPTAEGEPTAPVSAPTSDAASVSTISMLAVAAIVQLL